jgi:hypothetical protein
MKVPFEGETADLINKMMFETIYHAAIEQSYE